MNKHQAMTKDIQAVDSKSSSCQGIEPLHVQLHREQLPQKCDRTWQQLAASTERINQLSAELEAALYDLKEIASDIRQQQNLPRVPDFDKPALAIPYIYCKRPGLFVLKAKTVDLFAEEKAAYQLAQQLRHRTKTRLKRSRTMSLAHLSWKLRKFWQKLAKKWQSSSDRPSKENRVKINLSSAAKTTKIENRKRFVLQR